MCIPGTVSVQCAPSKVLEKVVVTHITTFFERAGWFPDEQHGYRAGRSCGTATLTMQESVLKDLEDGWDSIIIFADLSNAFDTINHQKILEKLRVYGLTESSINWYASYLSKRAQFVGLAGVRSEIIKMCRGAPQGSLSGSCLFSIVYGDIV